MTPIQKIVTICKTLFGVQPGKELSREYLSPIITGLNDIKASDLNFDVREIDEREKHLKAYEKAPVTYMPILELDTFTMSVFIVKSGGSLPLHDHPNMHGILKVISGKVKLRSYTVVESEQLPDSSNKDNILTHSLTSNVRTVIKNDDIVISSDDGCCLLTPKEGNIHEIQPLTSVAAFCDILVPPYADDSCHYYSEVATHPTQKSKRWLLRVPQPKSFWCDTITYKGPNVKNIDMNI